MDTEFNGSLAAANTASVKAHSAEVALLARALGLTSALCYRDLHRCLERCQGDSARAVEIILQGRGRIRGVGSGAIARLQAALQLSQHLAWAPLRAAPRLAGPLDCEDFLRKHLMGRRREHFGCLFLNAANRVLSYRDLFVGTLDGAAVYPREVVIAALEVAAKNLILVHNHPSGAVHPSAADLAVTAQLREALALVDIGVLDHFIVARDGLFSMAGHGVGGFVAQGAG